ncbi:hypothetical protein K458DRAFT_91926 [Lentithecium fluviatile CBS 122367]|uniref:Uncharacterized protein n=1 Tax=Lentithecium fluviatile CBS 122367 TaxID=1168545 RepID=A0A6G1IQG3_9PLEO|nr:hypothetical protein K458DRAFT_91926 [Lentithecium fluviatile CBS 122367]
MPFCGRQPSRNICIQPHSASNDLISCQPQRASNPQGFACRTAYNFDASGSYRSGPPQTAPPPHYLRRARSERWGPKCRRAAPI